MAYNSLRPNLVLELFLLVQKNVPLLIAVIVLLSKS